MLASPVQSYAKRVGRPTNVELAERDALIRRWAIGDWDDWLLERLVHRWGRTEREWQRRFFGMIGNDFLLITNGDATFLAEQKQHVMSGRPICMEVFAWARDATLKDNVYNSAGKALLPLYRRFNEWALNMKAIRAYAGLCSDYPPAQVKNIMGPNAYYITGAPC